MEVGFDCIVQVVQLLVLGFSAWRLSPEERSSAQFRRKTGGSYPSVCRRSSSVSGDRFLQTCARSVKTDSYSHCAWQTIGWGAAFGCRWADAAGGASARRALLGERLQVCCRAVPDPLLGAPPMVQACYKPSTTRFPVYCYSSSSSRLTTERP